MKLLSIIALTVAAFVALVTVGCTTPSSTVDTRRAKIPEFSVSKALVAPDAYHVPDATWSPEMESTIPRYTGGGLLPVLIGASIDKHVTSEQQQAFDKSQAALLPMINEHASKPPFVAIDNSIASAVRSNGFLAQRIRDNAKNLLEPKIVRFGLVRKNRGEEADPVMSAEVVVEVTIRVVDGTAVRIGKFSGSSRNGFAMSALADEPERIQTLYGEAADSFRDLANKILKFKYGE